MAKPQQVVLGAKVTPEFAARVDEKIAELREQFQPVRLTKSDALRLLLERGLTAKAG